MTQSSGSAESSHGSWDRLLGIHPRRTALAALALGAVLAAQSASAVAPRIVGHERIPSMAPAADGLSAVLIVATMLLVLVGPLAYAAWNGGPAGAAILGLAPILTWELVATRWALDVDLVIALCAAAGGVGLAVYAGESRILGTWRPWKSRRPPWEAVVFAAVFLALAAGLVGRFLVLADPPLRQRVLFALPFWVVPVGVTIAYLTHRADGDGRS